MIQAEALTKDYGSRRVLDRISFEVPQGAVLGFLGPNGAGKTTTMRILTGLARATSGRVRIGGFDVVRQQRDVARILGYLPEDAPLYPEMRVESYLATMAALKEIPARKVKSEVDRVLSETDLQKWRKRLISNISKGTRQRVGIAQALLGDPKVLVLDEPTVGLDPGQISDIRSLIARMRGSKTVIFSTHILPNVSMVCSHVVILNHGRVVVQGPVNQIGGGDGKRRVIMRTRGSSDEWIATVDARMKELAGASELQRVGEETLLTLTFPANGADPRGALAQKAIECGLELLELREAENSLEDFFLRAISQAPAESGGQVT
jgi:ABC-2 type transport system ATP-binding protein